MKITREIYALINKGDTKFSGREGQAWRENLAEIIPEIEGLEGQFKLTVTIEIPRKPGWYWASTGYEKLHPVEWTGEDWILPDGSKVSDSYFSANETRIPEPTDE